MPRKTRRGVAALRHILGFREFIERVERERVAKMAREDPTIFGRLLPFAMVLGVADEWAEAFEGLLAEPPQWYEGYDGRPFVMGTFIDDLGRTMHKISGTLRSSPGSSAGGGGSGFSGGFSGGGFGGGGGGSW